MSNQRTNNDQLDDENQGSYQHRRQRPRQFFRQRPGRKDQDLGEDETPRMNDSDENSPQENDMNNQQRGRQVANEEDFAVLVAVVVSFEIFRPIQITIVSIHHIQVT